MKRYFIFKAKLSCLREKRVTLPHSLLMFFACNVHHCVVQITECAKTLQIKGPLELYGMDLDDFGSGELNHDALDSFSKWTEVLHHSREHPETVLQVLLKCHEYDYARKWAHIYKANQLMLQVML